jgi:hypothetical protein
VSVQLWRQPIGVEKPADLSRIQHPVLVANGDADRMVPSSNSYDLPYWQGLVVIAVAGYISCWCAGKSGRQSVVRLVKGSGVCFISGAVAHRV